MALVKCEECGAEISDRAVACPQCGAPCQIRQGFKDPTALTKWAKLFLYVQIAMIAIATISNMLEYQMLSNLQDGVYSSHELAVAAAEASDARQGIVGIFDLVISVISAILILKWIYRANYNVRQLGAIDMVFTPGWSIGWYFIPIINLWKPYQAMKEIWKASSNPRSWKSQSISSLLPWWWFFWIFSNILVNVSIRMSIKSKEINELLITNIIDQFSCLIGIPLILIIISIINKIYEMQMLQAKTGSSSRP